VLDIHGFMSASRAAQGGVEDYHYDAVGHEWLLGRLLVHLIGASARPQGVHTTWVLNAAVSLLVLGVGVVLYKRAKRARHLL
jgi:hypothetical protein